MKSAGNTPEGKKVDKAKKVVPTKTFGATKKKTESDKEPMGRKGDPKMRFKKLDGKMI